MSGYIRLMCQFKGGNQSGKTTGSKYALSRHVSTGAKRNEALSSVQVIGEDTYYVIKILSWAGSN